MLVKIVLSLMIMILFEMDFRCAPNQTAQHVNVQLQLSILIQLLVPGMWKRLFFKRFRFRFHTYRFRFRFHQQKTKKRPLTIFFNFCGSVACLLLHFIILRKPKPSFIAITLPTSLKLIVSNYSVFLFLRYQNSR